MNALDQEQMKNMIQKKLYGRGENKYIANRSVHFQMDPKRIEYIHWQDTTDHTKKNHNFS